MDIKEYISSGILEQYVLCSVSSQEMQEVECMSSIYPEIKEELQRLQASIESLAMSMAKDPPSQLKGRILQEIENLPDESDNVISHDFNQENTQSSSSNSFWKVAVAACIIGLISTIFVWQNREADFKNQLVDLNTTQSELEGDNQKLGDQIASLEEGNRLRNEILEPGMTKVVMAGTEKDPTASARVFWNASKSKVILKIDNMPKNAKDKQYQLWAIVDGTPTDMGVFDVIENQDLIEITFDYPEAQAFAVTVEPFGGSKVPTLSEMIVVGNV